MNLIGGQLGVALGLAASVLAFGTIVSGLVTGRANLVKMGRNYVWVMLAGSIMAAFFMERALITRDFTILYVAENGSSTTPALFNFATLWAGLEGSIILWVLILAGYITAVAVKFRGRTDEPIVGWALATMFGVAIFFFALMIGPANPFLGFDPPPGFDGPGPNPLLQNHVLMAAHPPMLYLGYVGFTVPFAFAIGALVTGRVGEGWLVMTRRWALFAWGFLTAGILLGAWWSYEVLGWGGYWAWDPVENASLLPWLTATAFIHSVMVQERRGMLRVWNISLLAATFALTILGTFITRSGVLASVHAFSESGIGAWLLAFFAIIVALTVGLIGWRGDRLRAPGAIDSPVSREASFLANNVLFGAFAFVVLLGTLFPLVVEAVSGERISVGAPYFDRMTMPIGLTLLFLMAVAPVLPWRKASGELLATRLQWPIWGGVAAIVIALAAGAKGFAPLLAFGLSGFAAGSAIRQLVIATRRQGLRGFLGRTNGGMVVHLGVILIAVAFAASSSYLKQSEFVLMPGESVTFVGHDLTYIEPGFSEGKSKTETFALVMIDGAGPYKPALSRFNNAGQTVGTPAVKSTVFDDVQVSLLDAPDEESDQIRLRVTVQPLVVWLWIGGGIMAVGTVMSAFPGRRRRPTDPVSAPLSDRPSTRAATGPAGSGSPEPSSPPAEPVGID